MGCIEFDLKSIKHIQSTQQSRDIIALRHRDPYCELRRRSDAGSKVVYEVPTWATCHARELNRLPGIRFANERPAQCQWHNRDRRTGVQLH